jgi:hypothetical protein
VHAEFATRRLHRGVDLAGRNPDSFGDQLEVVDQCFHRGAHDLRDVLLRIAQAVGTDLQVGGPGDLAVLDHDRARLQLLQALLDDLERLSHLFDANDVAPVRITAVVGDHVELVVLVSAVRFVASQVIGQAGRAQDWAGDAQRHAAGQVEVADALGTRLPDVVLIEQVLQVAQPGLHQVKELANFVDRVGR